MNGSRTGAEAPHTNGVYNLATANHNAHPGIPHIVEALELIHHPTSSNETRKHASEFLEAQKADKDTSQNGFILASSKQYPAVARHFGLSLLEHFIRHIWGDMQDEQTVVIRRWILELGQGIDDQDPLYLRNKIAQLWAEIAKRSWGIDWYDMDETMVRFWGNDVLHKELVLAVLETLSEDVFHREDTASALRGTDLNRALVEVFTPAAVFAEDFPTRDHHVNLRYGNEGWLFRISGFLDWCVDNNINGNKQVKAGALRAMAVLKTVFAWAMPKAVISTHCVKSICRTLNTLDVQVIMAAIDALHALYSRSHFEEDEFRELVCPMYRTENTELLRKLYEWSVVEATYIDEEKYMISKKLSELMSHLADFVEEKPLSLPDDSDLPFLFRFLISMLRHQSLTVSIPILHSWVKLLVSETIGSSGTVSTLIGSLLETCSQRLVRYEALPEDSDDPAILFLNEDIDTMPERHAFLGNYRRYCVQIIEIIVQRHPREAIPHILSHVDNTLDNLYNGSPAFEFSTYKKNSLPIMRADTQCTVVEAALKGYSKWIITHGQNPQQDEQERASMEAHLEGWASKVLKRTFEDPLIKQRIIRLGVEFSTKALEKNPSFALKVLEYNLVVLTQSIDRPDFPGYSEAVKELYGIATHELRRLAMRYADYFATFYDQLESKIREILANSTLEEKPQTELSGVLVIVMQRASNIDPQLRQTRLQTFIRPMMQAWQDPNLGQSLISFEGFCRMLAVDQVGPYMQARQAHNIEDWSSIEIDDEGRALQDRMTTSFQRLPLRTTKTLLAVSTEKLERGSLPYNTACEMWRDNIPTMLPHLLQFISHAHIFHSPENWTDLPDEMQVIVGRVLTDRFWQAGISTGSRDEFYTKIVESKKTLEGFASSVRGKIRAVRESSYSILYCMSRLPDLFYGFEELPRPLSQALFTNATALSSHQFSVLLTMARAVIDDCPVKHRGHFLPPMLSTLFAQVDRKASTEWDRIERRKTSTTEGGGDDLTGEMKDESILRQLTYTAVMMVATLLDPQRGDPSDDHNHSSTTNHPDPNNASNDPTSSRPPPAPQDSLRTFILSSPAILEPLILFCTHALRIPDTRSCGIITKVLRSILPHFTPDDPVSNAAIRDFISTEVLKACITSVHEPYFVDLQRDLAQLIASIWILYGSKSNTVQSVLLQLPGITEDRVRRCEAKLVRCASTRQQRALVLDLLEGLRGVSISEQGRISMSLEQVLQQRATGDPRKSGTRSSAMMQERYMMDDGQGGGQKAKVEEGAGGGGEPDFGGVADMFG